MNFIFNLNKYFYTFAMLKDSIKYTFNTQYTSYFDTKYNNAVFFILEILKTKILNNINVCLMLVVL